MKYNYYVVEFLNNYIVGVRTICGEKEAAILAQAKMIKNGFDYKIRKIKKISFYMNYEFDFVV